MPEAKPSYFITTPIYYVNAKPHLGTAYCTLLCDIQARFRRAAGYDVFFLTGMDEHGEKVALAAADHGLSPQAWCDSQVPFFKGLYEELNISYDDFIRTTVKAVQYLWERMREAGFIYKGSYDGWYCIHEETFFTETQVEKADEEAGCKGAHLCPDCHRELERVSEESWFFKLSAFQDKLLELYAKHPDFIEPDFRANEVRSFVESGLQDISVSRTSFDWGIPVPIDEKHVIYVWLDALSNYITTLGYPDDRAEYDKYWPADVHLVGKEIVRFHSIIWPAMLMSMDEPLPKQVLGHGWLLIDGGKMSKSKGNVVDPVMLIERYGIDALKYFLLREYTFGQDGIFTNEIMLKRMNYDLANDLGNLLNRTLGMYKKYFNGVVVASSTSEPIDDEIKTMFDNVIKDVEKYMYLFEFSRALETIWKFISRLNKYVDETMPWSLAKDETKKARLATVMNILCEGLYKIAFLIAPYMPESAQKISNQLGIDKDITNIKFDDIKEWNIFKAGHKLGEASPIFPRIEIEKEEVVESKKELKVENPIDIKEFNKVEIKVVEILDVDKVKDADKLLKFKVFDGEFERQIISGLAKFYPDFKKLIGEKVLAVANLKFTKLKGEISQGMLLTTEDKNGVSLIKIDKSIEAGAIVS